MVIIEMSAVVCYQMALHTKIGAIFFLWWRRMQMCIACQNNDNNNDDDDDLAYKLFFSPACMTRQTASITHRSATALEGPDVICLK